jgi:pimeloyl-ACP methyl ester carboxylesterase
MRARLLCSLAVALSLVSAGSLMAASADDGEQLLTIDHHVPVRSMVPSISGQQTHIYVRERVKAGTALRGTTAGIVLFIHGAGTPAEVAFDVPYEDYSWMAYLARAGFDVFAMDTTGYGRSSRPPAMNDPCNLALEQQAKLGRNPCEPSYRYQLTTIASDWNDIGAVVDYLRTLRRADRVSLIAWSLGGPRSGGYAAQNPDKIEKLVLLAPAYRRDEPAAQPTLPAPCAALRRQR